jgi:hypothetical protein
MLKEFKDFAMRGNVLDMAIGVIIGGAFGKIVSSLVSDVLMPPIGLLMGRWISPACSSICPGHHNPRLPQPRRRGTRPLITGSSFRLRSTSSSSRS